MRLLAVSLLAAAALEIAVLVLVVHALGAGPTVALLILNVLVGSWLLRREGRRTVREVTEAARLRRPPERGLGDGVITAAGGILVMLPGFLSDLAGLVCLLPVTRRPLRGWVQRAAERRSQRAWSSVGAGWPGGAAAGWGAAGQGASAAPGEDVIDGEVISVDDEDDAPSARSQHRPLGRSAQGGGAVDGRDR